MLKKDLTNVYMANDETKMLTITTENNKDSIISLLSIFTASIPVMKMAQKI